MIKIAALLTTSLLFGGMTLYSFGFAPLVFSALPAETAGSLLRRALPHYFGFILITATVAAFCLAQIDLVSSLLMAAAAVIAVFARQILMPGINGARDVGAKQRFNRLHGMSIALTRCN